MNCMASFMLQRDAVRALGDLLTAGAMDRQTLSHVSLREYVHLVHLRLDNLVAAPVGPGTPDGDGDGVSQTADELSREEMRREPDEDGSLSPARMAALAVPGLVRLRARSLDLEHGSATRRWSISGPFE